MKIVIQCAATKNVGCGFLTTRDGRKVLFVADPASAPEALDVLRARPDDRSDQGGTWREVLLRCNRQRADNPLRLCTAAELYPNPVYSRAVQHFGPENVYILSAGWGLIPAPFLKNPDALRVLKAKLDAPRESVPPVMLRRMKEDILEGLPAKSVKTYAVPMPDIQASLPLTTSCT